MTHGHTSLVFGCERCIAERDKADAVAVHRPGALGDRRLSSLGLRSNGDMVCPNCGSIQHQQQQWRGETKYRRTCHDCQWTTNWIVPPSEVPA